MLKIDNLTIQTRQPILNDFSWTFESGKLYGIVATNGSGKTTFFRALTGLIPIISGEIFIDNRRASSKKKEIFYFESSEWFDKNLTGLDYLKFIKNEWHSKIAPSEVIEMWQMENYVNIPIKKYSLGMKQRLLIGLYQISDAGVMLMDEITNGLDEASRQILFGLLKSLTQKNKLIILSSHYKEDVISACDFMMTLENQEMKVGAL